MPLNIKKRLLTVRNGACWFLDRYGVYLPGLLVVLMVVLNYMPVRSMALQYDRMGILSGQFWRFYTYCLTHWDFNHFIWDILSFAILAYLCWEKSRKVFWGIMIVGPVAVSLALWLFFIELDMYRGIAGVTSGLVAAVAIFYLRDTSRRMNLMGMGIILLVLAKVMIELHSGRSLMAKHEEVTAIIMVYVAGGMFGMVVTTLSFLRKPKEGVTDGI